nr:phospholipid carrier-dependent glycosyltransferase [uncultured Roseateles sp.]
MVTTTLAIGAYRNRQPSLLATSLWMVTLVGIVVVYRLLTLGSYPLSDNTEARYAEIARLMLTGGDWITLHLPGDVVFWGKPPLSTWLSALGQGVLGANEWGARVPVFFTALLTSLLIWRWANAFSRRVGMLCMALLWGSVLFFVSAGAVMTDMALTLAVTLAVSGYWWAISETTLAGVRLGALALFTGLGLGLLAKGPVAVMLSLAPMAAHACSGRDAFRDALFLPWFRGALVVTAIAVPWYVLAEMRSPGFLDYFLIGEHWKRFTQPGWAGDLYGTAHVQPRGLIWAFMLAGLLPWTFLLPWLLLGRREALGTAIAENSRGGKTAGENVLLIGWALAPALLFTVSRNILWTYVLPAVPALALLLARWLSRDPRRSLVNGVITLGIVLLIGTSALLIGWRSQIGGFRSAAVVLMPLQQSGHHADEVSFLNTLPYSASFYSRGAATSVVKEDALQSWLDGDAVLGPDHRHEFLIASSKQWRVLPEPMRAKLSIVSESAGYVLLVRVGK